MENGKSPSFLINTIKSLRRCSMAMWVYRSVIFFTCWWFQPLWKISVNQVGLKIKDVWNHHLVIFFTIIYNQEDGCPTPIHLPTLPYEQPQLLATELTLASSRWPSKLSWHPKKTGFLLPGKLTCPLKIHGWKMYFLLKWSLFRGHVDC